jgi:S1-C subfamily serine protease
VSFLPALTVQLPEELPFEKLPFEEEPSKSQAAGGIAQAVVIGKGLPGSPAEGAGLQEKDFITQVDGQTVDSPEALAQRFRPASQATRLP